MEEETDKKKMDKKEPKPISRTLKIVTTIVIFYGNVTYGCAMNAFSPALTDFKNKYDTDTSTISVVFVASIGAYMVGALLCTVIYNIINRQFAVALLFVGISTVMFVAPFVPNLSLFYVAGGVLGFCIGCYDAAQFVWVMEIWQKDSGPYIQAQHFCFAVGTVISPVIMSPFLTEEEDPADGITTTMKGKEENSRLFVPFTIIGCLCAVTAIAQLLLFIFMRYRPPPPEAITTEENNIDNKDDITEKGNLETEKKPSKTLVKWFYQYWPGWGVARLVILSALTLGSYQGMEMCTMQLFPTFGQKSDVQLSESAASDTLTGLTMAFMVGRGASIILIFKIPPLLILSANVALVFIGNILLVIWGNSSKSIIWAAGILYGLGFSSLLPSFCAYMERYLEFTNTIGAMMIVSGSFVGSMYPLIVGGIIDDHALVITYPVFFSVAVVICSVSVAYSITRKTKNRIFGLYFSATYFGNIFSGFAAI